MLWGILFIMTVQVLFAWSFYCARQESNRPRPEWGAAGLVFLLFCFTSGPPLLQYVTLWWFKSRCLNREVSSARFLKYSLVMSLIILLPFGLIGWGDSAEVRKEFPLRSMADRLAYETPAKRNATSLPPNHLRSAPEESSTLTAPPLSINIDDLYDNGLASERGKRRASELQRLHESYLDDFVNSPGFGVGRMVPMRIQSRPLEKYRDKPPRQPSRNEPSEKSPSAGAPQTPSRAPTNDQLAQLLPLHQVALVDFANPEGFGWVQDRDHVAGFEPHGFAQVPKQKADPNKLAKWQTLRVELVSLLKHQQPMVYESEKLPDMQELKTAFVRPLDAFESRALSVLIHEHRELIGEITGPHLRMLGSIRAAKQCLSCHNVSHGDLLGAFAYQLLDKFYQHTEPQEAAPEAF